METLGIRMYVGKLLVATTALQLARQRLFDHMADEHAARSAGAAFDGGMFRSHAIGVERARSRLAYSKVCQTDLADALPPVGRAPIRHASCVPHG